MFEISILDSLLDIVPNYDVIDPTINRDLCNAPAHETLLYGLTINEDIKTKIIALMIKLSHRIENIPIVFITLILFFSDLNSTFFRF